MPKQIILKKLQRPAEINLSDDIMWLGESLGFSAGRDIEKVAVQILKRVLGDAARKGCSSSDSLAGDLDLSVQRVNYHLRSLVDAGFLFREKRQIFVREGSAKAAVEEIRRDANRIFDDLSEIAGQIDEILGLRNRKCQ